MKHILLGTEDIAVNKKIPLFSKLLSRAETA